jgi:hypothetical protein
MLCKKHGASSRGKTHYEELAKGARWSGQRPITFQESKIKLKRESSNDTKMKLLKESPRNPFYAAKGNETKQDQDMRRTAEVGEDARKRKTS